MSIIETARRRRAGEARAATRLGPLERSVITLSRADDLASLAPGGRFTLLTRRMFGMAGTNRLADPRLETLRRYAVELRHGGDDLAATTRAELVNRGFALPQVAHARWLVSRERHGGTDGGGTGRAVAAVVALIAIWTAIVAAGATGDRTIGLIAGLLLAATIVPLLSVPARRRRRPAGVALA